MSGRANECNDNLKYLQQNKTLFIKKYIDLTLKKYIYVYLDEFCTIMFIRIFYFIFNEKFANAFF